MTAIACGWLDDGTVLKLEAQKRADAQARPWRARNWRGSGSSAIRLRISSGCH
jgi:hypothetical protein